MWGLLACTAFGNGVPACLHPLSPRSMPPPLPPLTFLTLTPLKVSHPLQPGT